MQQKETDIECETGISWSVISWFKRKCSVSLWVFALIWSFRKMILWVKPDRNSISCRFSSTTTLWEFCCCWIVLLSVEPHWRLILFVAFLKLSFSQSGIQGKCYIIHLGTYLVQKSLKDWWRGDFLVIRCFEFGISCLLLVCKIQELFWGQEFESFSWGYMAFLCSHVLSLF